MKKLLEGFISQHFQLILILVIGCLLIYILAGVLEAIIDAVQDFKSRKKEPMYWCNKHGYFPKKHCLNLFPEMNIESLYCPQCYYEQTFKGPNDRLKAS